MSVGALKNYRVSVLALRYGAPDGSALHRLHAEEWIVWEPGMWHAPPRSGDTLVESSQAPLQLAQSEPLAFPLARGATEIVVGRSPKSAIAVNDGTLSAAHFALSMEDQRWVIRDLGSSNGTELDGHPAPANLALPLRNGMQIRAGEVTLTFYSAEGMLGRLQAFLRSPNGSRVE